MPILLGIDVGTTTITALALDAGAGAIVASHTLPNESQITSADDQARGRSEWDAERLVEQACHCLKEVAGRLGSRSDLAGIGITGQQHGMVVVDAGLGPLTPLINWQDRRGEDRMRGAEQTYVQRARELVGPEAPARAGCRLATGYLGVALFWMKENDYLPRGGVACFIMDYLAAALTGRPPATDPTCGASSGLFDVRTGTWDLAAIGALGLPESFFPEVRTSGDLVGSLTAKAALATGLPVGLPVFVGIGDNQASFLGSVAERDTSVLVNVGTGAQVAAYTERFAYDPELETRPFPRGGYLLVSAGLAGGAAYAVLERFFRAATQLGGAAGREPLYAQMNELAAKAPRGADGLRCEPFFSGTRADPTLRASFSGGSAANFTPAHMTRALLEGMARTLRQGHDRIAQQIGGAHTILVGAGNGLRENPVLAEIVALEFGLPLQFPSHREEAAYGAALLAGVGSGVLADMAAAGRMLTYARM